MISPAALNFLAGLLAATGINILTAVLTGPVEGASTGHIGLDAALWVVAAGFLTWAAQTFQRAERDADLEIDRDFSLSERREIRDDHLRQALQKARVPLALTAAALISAVLLLPGLLV